MDLRHCRSIGLPGPPRTALRRVIRPRDPSLGRDRHETHDVYPGESGSSGSRHSHDLFVSRVFAGDRHGVCGSSSFETTRVDRSRSWLLGQNVTRIRSEVVVMRACVLMMIGVFRHDVQPRIRTFLCKPVH